MKSLLSLISLIAVITVDCRGHPGPDSQLPVIAEQREQTQVPTFTLEPEAHSEATPATGGSSEGPTFTLGYDIEEENVLSESELEDISEENGLSESELRASCKPKLACTILGGDCVTSAANCMGKLVPNSCKGSNCVCCVPGCPEGFFQLTGASQCFKLYNDQLRNWTQAHAKCQSQKLVLAKPFNAVGLRSYLVERYGGRTDANAWVGARGNGTYMTWLADNVILSSGSPLWINGHPGSRLSSSYCLLLLSRDSWWLRYPTKTYYAQRCTTAGHWTLCELPME